MQRKHTYILVMETPSQGGNFITRPIDRWRHKVADEMAASEIKRFATDSDGKINSRLADHILTENSRRSEMARQLDILEPAQWAVEKTGLATAIGLGAMHLSNKPFTRGAVGLLIGTTALSSLSDMVRVPTRFRAGLKGGLDVAMVMDALDQKRDDENGSPRPNFRQKIANEAADRVSAVR